jgi:alkyl sulfatase BDS1-like metallo-beta-lactamase superfamily hydrolase
MRRLVLASFFASSLVSAAASAAESAAPAHIGRLRAGGYAEFGRFIGSSKGAVEEKFYNVKITQDGNVAWVMFDYEFLVDGKAQNYGVETWQMMKIADDKWKIASVM